MSRASMPVARMHCSVARSTASDDGFWGEALIGVKERGEAEFGVNNVVGGQLFEYIFGDEAQSIFSLHELKAARSAGEKVSEAGALRWSDKLGVVLRASNFGRQAGDSIVAQRAVEVEVEFDLA